MLLIQHDFVHNAERRLCIACHADDVPWNQETRICAGNEVDMAEDKTSDELTERDIEDLNDPDDNPDVADADATEHNLRRAVIICFIVTSVMCLCINIAVLLMLQRKGKLDKAAADLDEFKENMQHLASDKSRQIARNKDVRKAMDTISQHIHEIPSEAQSAVTRVRDSFAK